MTDLLALIGGLRRPRLLIRAAHHGLPDYSRTRDLTRLLRSSAAPSVTDALESLLAEEEAIEQRRRSGATAYSIVRHIDILVALIAEARLLARPEAS